MISRVRPFLRISSERYRGKMLLRTVFFLVVDEAQLSPHFPGLASPGTECRACYSAQHASWAIQSCLSPRAVKCLISRVKNLRKSMFRIYVLTVCACLALLSTVWPSVIPWCFGLSSVRSTAAISWMRICARNTFSAESRSRLRHRM